MNKHHELHIHLDGSLPYETVLTLIKKNDGAEVSQKLPEDIHSLLTVSPDCRSLNEYLEKFDFPLSLLQTVDAVQLAVHDLGIWLSEREVEYAEIRFAPQLHTGKGLNQEAVATAAVNGIKQLKSEGAPIDLRLIFCLMRGDMTDSAKYEANMETVHIAEKCIDIFGNEMIAGLDLAGAEALFPTEDFREFFEEAKRLNIPFTIHAGEAAGPESIWSAIDMGAMRIGHGIAAAKDEKLMKYMAERGIAVEMCPTSNLQTKAVTDMKEYPIRKFLEYGIPVTINTDNTTVSGTDIQKEFLLLRETIGLTEEEEMKIRANSRKCHL